MEYYLLYMGCTIHVLGKKNKTSTKHIIMQQNAFIKICIRFFGFIKNLVLYETFKNERSLGKKSFIYAFFFINI